MAVEGLKGSKAIIVLQSCSFYFSFLLLLQKKRNKEKESGNANHSQNGRPLHKPLRATVLAAVRTISGFATTPSPARFSKLCGPQCFTVCLCESSLNTKG